MNKSKVLLAIGVVLIAGGEAFCIAGPLRYEHPIHIVCHLIFYTGVVTCSIGAIQHYRQDR